MAKPNHVLDNLYHPRSPSPALLSALALIAASQSAAALPTQLPDFLCPFIKRDHNPTPTTTTTTTIHSSHCTGVADKFVQGSDSLWRKTSSWTLFGSTCAAGSSAGTSAQPQSTPSQAAPSTNEFDTSVLPAGWDSGSSSSTTTEPSIILALAIILAGSICIFMICCVIWRRRKKKARDIERKLAHRPSSHADSQADGRENDARGKIRMWAKATARWKSTIRVSARRRKKRTASSPAHRPLSPTPVDSPPFPASSAPSRRASIAPEELDPSPPDAALSVNGSVTDPPAGLPDPPRSPSPPAYGASLDPRFIHPPFSSPVSRQNLSPSSAGSYSLRQPSTDDEPLPYTPPHDGHVATDDKSQLAHIQALASSPIIDDATSTSAVQSVSAPEWHEVEDSLEDLGIDLSKVPTSSYDFDLPPPFPPPPSKADIPLPFVYMHDHSFRYEEEDDILASLHIPVSSGPPLGGLPSAPPIDDPGLEPSAPSLEGEDELFQYWEQASPHVPEDPSSVDLASTSARAASSSSSISPIPSTMSFASSIPEPAARDGILPRYHP